MKRYSYQEVKEKLGQSGMDLIGSEIDYNKGVMSIIDIKCKNNHIWKGRINNVFVRLNRESKGCPQCAENIYIKQSYDIAMEKKPEKHVILESYLKEIKHVKNNHVRIYKLRCEYNHVYEKRNADISNGCPKCSEKTYVGQERVRLMFEKEFGLVFPTVRPDWLKNPATNRNLELDGYCDKLQLAFEYQGRQHSSNDTQFGGDYSNQKERDDYKFKACEAHGIKLITVLQPRSYDKNKFFESVVNNCMLQGVNFKSVADNIDFNKINDTNTAIKSYENFKEFASDKGYQLISSSLSTMEDTVEFKCNHNHYFNMKCSTFKTMLNTTKYRNEPCLECHNINNPDKVRDIITIDTCKNFALENKLICLSTEYKNVNEKMNWQCNHGHVFIKSYRQFLRSKTQNYCPDCSV